MDAPIYQHDDHGAFQWNVSRAIGGSSANPFLATDSSTASSSSALNDQSQTRLIQAHGPLASIAFIAIFPTGAILVRLASFSNLAWIHAGLQILGYVVFIAAAGVGFFLAQDKSYLQKPHAVNGLLLLSVLFFMPILGAIQHNRYKKLQQRTVWSYGRIFIGRVMVILRMINGGLGLRLADAQSSYMIAYGVFAGFVSVSYIVAIVFGEIKRVGKKEQEGVVGMSTNRRKEKRTEMERVDSDK